MSRRDWKNIIFIFLDIFSGTLQLIDINSLITKLQNYSEGNWKIIEFIDDVKLLFIFSLSTAFLLVYNKKLIKKYLDQITGWAEQERKHKERMEDIAKKSEKRLELDMRNRKKQQIKETEEAQAKEQERNELLKALKDDLFYEENLDTKVIKNRKYWKVKAMERLKKFGFVVPDDEERELPGFDECWEDFLSTVIAVIECRNENEDDNFNLWEKFQNNLIPF